MVRGSSHKWLLTRSLILLLLTRVEIVTKTAWAADDVTVADMPTVARAPTGDFISWREHRIAAL